MMSDTPVIKCSPQGENMKSHSFRLLTLGYPWALLAVVNFDVASTDAATIVALGESNTYAEG
jgi:hypothetical protein